MRQPRPRREGGREAPSSWLNQRLAAAGPLRDRLLGRPALAEARRAACPTAPDIPTARTRTPPLFLGSPTHTPCAAHVHARSAASLRVPAPPSCARAWHARTHGGPRWQPPPPAPLGRPAHSSAGPGGARIGETTPGPWQHGATPHHTPGRLLAGFIQGKTSNDALAARRHPTMRACARFGRPPPTSFEHWLISICTIN